MLSIFCHQDFKKDYSRLKEKTKRRFEEKCELFMKSSFDRTLQNHPLRGKLAGLWSFSVEGDIQVIYRYVRPNTVLFLRIGSHNQVYQ